MVSLPFTWGIRFSPLRPYPTTNSNSRSKIQHFSVNRTPSMHCVFVCVCVCLCVSMDHGLSCNNIVAQNLNVFQVLHVCMRTVIVHVSTTVILLVCCVQVVPPWHHEAYLGVPSLVSRDPRWNLPTEAVWVNSCTISQVYNTLNYFQ